MILLKKPNNYPALPYLVQGTQNPPGLASVWVRFPPPAPILIIILRGLRIGKSLSFFSVFYKVRKPIYGLPCIKIIDGVVPEEHLGSPVMSMRSILFRIFGRIILSLFGGEIKVNHCYMWIYELIENTTRFLEKRSKCVKKWWVNTLKQISTIYWHDCYFDVK